MGTRLDTDLTFDGTVSTADQFSSTFSGLGGRPTVAFMFDVDMVAGPMAITLQGNPDLAGETVLSWNDIATSALKILDTTNSVYLPQINGSIQSGDIRGGVINLASGSGVYYFEFSPVEMSYRLRFQITGTTDATVNNIFTLP